MLTCAEVVNLVTDYYEGRLTPAERRRFEEHIRSARRVVRSSTR
jgi:Putative zinc-finger